MMMMMMMMMMTTTMIYCVETFSDHSPPSSAEVKNAWSYTYTPQYAFMAWCSAEAQGQLYLYLYLYLYVVEKTNTPNFHVLFSDDLSSALVM